MAAPILKWAGGKSRILHALLFHLDIDPSRHTTYVEPFLGGGSVFFAVQAAATAQNVHPRFLLNDANAELINLYRVVRERQIELIQELQRPQTRSIVDVSSNLIMVNAAPNQALHYRYDDTVYYAIRALDPIFLSSVERAARTLYLNRTGFNGLYRVNKSGRFNVPFGRHTNPRIFDRVGLGEASIALATAELTHVDFEHVVRPTLARHCNADTCPCANASLIYPSSTVIYCDSPYVPIVAAGAKDTASFTAYGTPFGEPEHRRLAIWARGLVEQGARVVLSNADMPLVRDLYPESQWDLHSIDVRRSISSSGERNTVRELVIVGKP